MNARKHLSLSLLLLMVATKASINQTATTKAPAKVQSSSGLGEAHYLPTKNIFDTSKFTQGNGRVVLDVRSSCILSDTSSGNSRSSLEISSSMYEKVEKVATTFALKGSFPVKALIMGPSVQFITKRSSTLTTAFQSVSAIKTDLKKTLTFKANCQTEENLNSIYRSNFELIPLIDCPVNSDGCEVPDSSWEPYIRFLQKYGSHVTTQIEFGTHVEELASSTSTVESTLTSLTTNVCAKMRSVGFKVNGCAENAKEDTSESTTTSSRFETILLGGTSEARTAYHTDASAANREKFLLSADRGDPIGFEFTPVWDVLKDIYTPMCRKDEQACEHLQRAFNLQAAFEGFLVVKCTTEKGIQGMKGFKDAGDDKMVKYKCQVSSTGCSSNADCSKDKTSIWDQCICSTACRDTGDRILGTSLYRTSSNYLNKKEHDQGLNAGCVVVKSSTTWDYECTCDTGHPNQLGTRFIYDQNNPDLGKVDGGYVPLQHISSCPDGTMSIVTSLVAVLLVFLI